MAENKKTDPGRDYPNIPTTFLVIYTSEESRSYKALEYHLQMAGVDYKKDSNSRIGSIDGEELYEHALKFVTHYYLHADMACDIMGLRYNKDTNFYTAQLP